MTWLPWRAGVIEVWLAVGTDSTDNSPEDAMSARWALDHCPWVCEKAVRINTASVLSNYCERGAMSVLAVFPQSGLVAALGNSVFLMLLLIGGLRGKQHV